jgi:hypothetical protein
MNAGSFARRTALVCIGVIAGCGVFPAPPAPLEDVKDSVLRWNRTANDASGYDHTRPPPGNGEQLGPGRAARAMAIVHIAIFDAINAVQGGFESYTRTPPAAADTSLAAAIAQAAHDTLVALFPSQQSAIDQQLAEDLDSIEDGQEKESGIALGRQVAAAILAMREGDGAELPEEYTFSFLPGFWRADPVNPGQKPLGSQWFRVKPFALNSASQFRSPPPPEMTSPEYTQAYNEVKALGGDGIVTPTIRTTDQTETGIYWAYDGTPSLCAPPRLYNQIAVQIASDRGLGGVELARLLALVNVALADAGIAIWESKYYYNFWRPVTGIRESDPPMGPSGLGDGNPDTVGDPTYLPLCAPASNLIGKNFTPAFPAYPSGHAGFGAALFQTLRDYFGTDDIPFTFVSDEYNGITRDNLGNVRPLLPRSFASFSQAEEENGQSRIYLGIHWRFDKTEGIAQGRQIGDHVFNTTFRPLP